MAPMNGPDTKARLWTGAQIEARIVRYDDLRPCRNAFIDTRSPGSEDKENFTIIGPGVSENPEQHVHIAEPHGFNIGGARQPPDCVNSQHSHDTAEVFIVHSGRWRFDLGEQGEDAQVTIGPGDVVSLPVKTFRGFTNVGDDIGFLFAILGQDDPGRVLWVPAVFEMAEEYGLVLLESGRLIDTVAGQQVPADARPMPVTSAQQVSEMKRYSQADAERLIWRADEHASKGSTAIIGDNGPLDAPHGFALSRLDLSPGEGHALPVWGNAEVLFVHQNDLILHWPDGEARLGPGDTMSIPPGTDWTLTSEGGCAAYRVARA